MGLRAWFIIAIAAIFVLSPVSLSDRMPRMTGSLRDVNAPVGSHSLASADTGPRSLPRVTQNCTESKGIIDTSSVCEWVPDTLPRTGGGNTIVIPFELTVEGSGTVVVANQTPMFLNSSLAVEGGAKVIFGGGNVLYIGYSSVLQVLQGSSVLLNNAKVSVLAGDISQAGSILVDHGSLMGNATTIVPPAPEVFGVNFYGPLSSLAVNGSAIRWVNATQQIGSVAFSGSYSALAMAQHFNASSVNMFSADNAILDNVTLGEVGNMTLGNSNQILDQVSVTNLTINAQILGTFTVSHANINHLSWSGASYLIASQSTFSNEASGVITAVSKSFQATDNCIFSSSLIFNDSTISVRMENDSALSLVFNKATHAQIYNWWGNTTDLTQIPKLAGISVTNSSAYVQVFRYVTFLVQSSGSSVPPQSAQLAIRRSNVENAPWTYYQLVDGTIGLFLLTDNVTSLADAFQGGYDIQANAGSASASQSVNLVGDGETVSLTLSSPSSTSLWTFWSFIAEIALLIVLTAATLVLLFRNRRRTSKPEKKPPEGSQEPKKDEAETALIH